MKALYTVIDDTLYQVNQKVNIPTNMIRVFHDHNSLSTNTDNHQVSVQIWLNNFNQDTQRSNKEIYEDITRSLKENLITQIDPIQNLFRMTINYTLYGKDGREIDQSVAVQPIKPVDSLVPLGINEENECVYRFVKSFRKKLDFRFKDSTPYGIMGKKSGNYTLIINSINIYQDENPYKEIHASFEGKPFRPTSPTVESCLEHMKLVYSSSLSGQQFEPIMLPFIPRVVNFDFEILLENYMMVYDDEEIKKILIENLLIKEGDEPEPVPPCPPCPPHPHHPHRPPHHHRKWVYYRSVYGKPNTLVVVEDVYPDSLFNKSTMVRKRDVVPDIPDIEVGEYVVKMKREPEPVPPCPPCPPHPHHPHRPPHPDICHRPDYKEFKGDYIISLFEDPEEDEDDYLSDGVEIPVDDEDYLYDENYYYGDDGYGE